MPDHARSDDAGVQAQLDRFAQLSPGRDILGLERITALLDRLGNPHRAVPPVFHVAGTNGKGSTCAFLRAGLEAAGLRVHVYTSPHLVRFNERIRLGSNLIDDPALALLLGEVLDAAGSDIGPSFFEATTAAAFLAFSRAPADYCVVEVGLGGRLDATNVISDPLVCGIAQVDIDHQSFLGETLSEIAGEKAGIAKAGVPLVAMRQAAQAIERIEAVAADVGAPLLLEGRDWDVDTSFKPGMAGDHQLRNAGLAGTMLRVARDHSHRIEISEDAIRSGIASATWPARLQCLAEGPLAQGREIWIDGAHNPAAARALANALAARPNHLVLGILANKDADGIIAPLAPHALSMTFVAVPEHDSHDPAILAARWGGRAARSLQEALAATAQTDSPPRGRGSEQTSATLIAGSLYLAGEALRLNEQVPS